MIDGQTTDRRLSPRHAAAASVRFRHEPSGRDFPGRCVNLSAGGLLMHVPAAVPVAAGQAVRLALGRVDHSDLAGLSDAHLEGRVVRVERQALLSQGHLAVAIRFAR
jgi:hypothetical protein